MVSVRQCGGGGARSAMRILARLRQTDGRAAELCFINFFFPLPNLRLSRLGTFPHPTASQPKPQGGHASRFSLASSPLVAVLEMGESHLFMAEMLE